jgi:DNA-3-methyladenine glycosylase
MRLVSDFLKRDVLKVAPDLLGKKIKRVLADGNIIEDIITETEAYRGEEDLACHASKGRTTRTEVMYNAGGVLYVYLIYGMYWLINVVTGNKDDPQAVLLRSLKNTEGPGRVGRFLELDSSFYGEDLRTSSRIWIEDVGITRFDVKELPRVGVGYAGEWSMKPWRFKSFNI